MDHTTDFYTQDRCFLWCLTFLVLIQLGGCSGATNDEGVTRDYTRISDKPSSSNHQTSSLIDLDQIDYSFLRLNEVNARQAPSDWIEVYNLGNQVIDLTGCFLSDEESVPYKAIIPPIEGTLIQPYSYLVLYISDETFGFKLGKEDGIWLSDPDGNLIDGFAYTEEMSSQGITMGRLPDGSENWISLSLATPNQPNRDQGVIEEDGLMDEGQSSLSMNDGSQNPSEESTLPQNPSEESNQEESNQEEERTDVYPEEPHTEDLNQEEAIQEEHTQDHSPSTSASICGNAYETTSTGLILMLSCSQDSPESVLLDM